MTAIARQNKKTSNVGTRNVYLKRNVLKIVNVVSSRFNLYVEYIKTVNIHYTE